MLTEISHQWVILGVVQDLQDLSQQVSAGAHPHYSGQCRSQDGGLKGMVLEAS